jgi:hypothetical protein
MPATAIRRHLGSGHAADRGNAGCSAPGPWRSERRKPDAWESGRPWVLVTTRWLQRSCKRHHGHVSRGVSASHVAWPSGFCGAQRLDKAGSPGSWSWCPDRVACGDSLPSRGRLRRRGAVEPIEGVLARRSRVAQPARAAVGPGLVGGSALRQLPSCEAAIGAEAWRSRRGTIGRQRTSELAASGQALPVRGRGGSVAGTRVRRHAARATRSSRGKKPRHRELDMGAAKRSPSPRSQRNAIMPRCAASAAAEAQRAE